MKYLVSFSLVLLTFISCTSSDKTAYNTSEIDAVFENAVIREHIPGAVAIVKKGDQIVYHKAFGFQQIENSTPMTKKTIFRLASMTKGLTAVSILQLRDAGKLRLDDPVSKYLPAFKHPEILVEVLTDSTFSSKPAEGEITIHQLLTHTSGIGYGFQEDSYNALVIKNNISEGFCEDNRTSLENTNKIAALPLLVNPGEKYIYGLSYDVLGTLIELVSGQRYDAYVQEHILSPLGMNDSYFIVPKEQRYRISNVYEPGPDNKGLVLSTYKDINYPMIETRQFHSAGADLCGTAEDYSKFVSMIMNFGTFHGVEILQKSSVEEMLSPQTSFNDGDSNQGFGAWVVNEKGAKSGARNIGSFDFGGFFDTYSWGDPKADITAVLMLQMYPTNAHDIHWKFQKIVYNTFQKK